MVCDKKKRLKQLLTFLVQFSIIFKVIEDTFYEIAKKKGERNFYFAHLSIM